MSAGESRAAASSKLARPNMLPKSKPTQSISSNEVSVVESSHLVLTMRARKLGRQREAKGLDLFLTVCRSEALWAMVTMVVLGGGLLLVMLVR